MFDGNTLKDFLLSNWEMVFYFYGLLFVFMMIIILPIYVVIQPVTRFLFPKVLEREII